MTDKTSTDQYGRKTWDLAAYEAEAKSRKDLKAALAQALQAQNALRKKDLLAQRADLLNLSVLAINKHTLISTEASGSSSVYGRNKRFGFACPVCDLSFRDTLALVDHFNSPQHIANLRKISGDSGGGEELENGIKRASLEQVAQTLDSLVAKKLRQELGTLTMLLKDRIERRQAFEESRAKRRRNRKEQRLLSSAVAAPDSEIALLMGFGDFGTTKLN